MLYHYLSPLSEYDRAQGAEISQNLATHPCSSFRSLALTPIYKTYNYRTKTNKSIINKISKHENMMAKLCYVLSAFLQSQARGTDIYLFHDSQLMGNQALFYL